MKDTKTTKLGKQTLMRALRIFRYVLPYRVKFIAGLICLFLSSITFMTFPGLIGRLFAGDDAKNSAIDAFFNLSNINQVALLLLGAFTLQAVFSFFRIYLFADVTERAIAAIRRDTYNHLVHLPMRFFSEQRVGELNSRISNDIAQLQDTFMTTLAEMVRQFLTIVIGISLLFFFSIELTLVMLISMPAMMIVAYFFGKFIRKLSKKTQSAVARSQVVVDETLQGIQSVKAYVNEPFEQARYHSITEEVRRVAMKGAKWRGAFASFIILGLFGAIVLVIWYGVKLKNEGEIGMDVLMSFILYSVFVGGSIGGIADIFGKIQKAVGATESLFDLMEESSEAVSSKNDEVQHSISGAVTFREVQFSYPSRSDVEVLRSLSFEVKEGQRVAIVGASGAGKSTVASLVLRFYDPTSGEISFDEVPATAIPLKELRSQIAYVPQEVLLFGGSIAENIRYGKLTATDEEIHEAARKANALEFISSFPAGFDTLVGERGIQLSGGQRQRIAIARAILKNPKLLLLDEATSALDAESERVVQEALEELMKDRTSIIIAHRLSTVRKADKIIVLEHGVARESGKHEELMEIERGVYRHLNELQLID